MNFTPQIMPQINQGVQNRLIKQMPENYTPSLVKKPRPISDAERAYFKDRALERNQNLLEQARPLPRPERAYFKDRALERNQNLLELGIQQPTNTTSPWQPPFTYRTSASSLENSPEFLQMPSPEELRRAELEARYRQLRQVGY